MNLNDLLVMWDLGRLKGMLGSLVLPPLPLILLVLLGLWMMRKHRVRGAVVILLSTAALWLLSTTLVGSALTQALVRPPPALTSGALGELKQPAIAQRTAIVVLGAGRETFAPEYGLSNLTPYSMERLRYGVWLSRTTGLPLAFAGGVSYGSLAGPTEAEIAARIAANEFARPLKWVESASRDTNENAHYTVSMLRSAGIDRIVLVTHGFHMTRAMGAFERSAKHQGVNITVTPAPMGLARDDDGWLPTPGGLTRSRLALREWIGRMVGS